MPKYSEIKVFNTSKTTVVFEEVQNWLSYIGADQFEIPFTSAVSDASFNIALAAKRCYMSFQPGLNPNVTQVRRNYVEFFDNILSSGHGSVLEHSSYGFNIEGISRVCTAELNRHHVGWAISEGSMRFIRFDKEIPYWLPTCLRADPNGDEDLEQRKRASRIVFEMAFSYTEKFYSELLEIWDMNEGHHNFSYKKKITSALRRIVPMGVSSGGKWTGNFRALRHVMALRTDPAAEEEILHVFGLIADLMIKSEPLIFGDFEKHEDSYIPKYHKV